MLLVERKTVALEMAQAAFTKEKMVRSFPRSKANLPPVMGLE